jgi:hypothetical protein
MMAGHGSIAHIARYMSINIIIIVIVENVLSYIISDMNVSYQIVSRHCVTFEKRLKTFPTTVEKN